MAGGIEQSKQFWAIQAAKPRSVKWNTLQVHSVGDPAALSYASELDAKVAHNIRVIPSDRQGNPVGEAIPHLAPANKPVASKPSAPASNEISKLEEAVTSLSKKPKKNK